MTRRLTLLFVLIALGVGGYLFVQGGPWGEGSGDEGPGPDNGGTTTTRDSGTTGQANRTDPNGRTEIQPGQETDASIRYRVVNARTQAGIAGAQIRKIKDGRSIATTDAEGFATITGIGLPYMVFGAEGYLLNYYQAGDADTETAVQRFDRLGYVEVRLEPDRFTIPFSLRFLEPDGSPARKVTFRIAPLDEPKPAGRAVPMARLGTSHVEPRLRQAWLKHYRMVMAGRMQGLTHLGADSDLMDFRCDGQARVHFVAQGYYSILARSEAGGFADKEFQVVLRQKDPKVVKLEKGVYLKGRVTNAKDGAPVQRAQIQVKEDGRFVHLGETDVEGRFRIGPWNRRRVHLDIQQNWFRNKTVGPVVASDQDILVQMQPRPVVQIRGVVRRRPDLGPVVGAELVALVEGVEEARARTDTKGVFLVQSPSPQPRIQIRAQGYLDYAEIVDANAGVLTYDLLPKKPEARQRARLSALLSGRVIGDDGKPAGGEPVHILPEKQPQLLNLPSRRILEGGVLTLPRTVFTAKDGRFVLEWNHAGGARLIAIRGLVDKRKGRYVNVVLGQPQNGIELILGR